MQGLSVNCCHYTAVSCSINAIWPSQQSTVDSKNVLVRLWHPWGVSEASTKGPYDVSLVLPPTAASPLNWPQLSQW